MKALKVKPQDLVPVAPEGLGDLDRGVRDVAKILTEREEALRVAFRLTLARARPACNELDSA
jgi:hypothetical protein